jgi:hypothetical protein
VRFANEIKAERAFCFHNASPLPTGR